MFKRMITALRGYVEFFCYHNRESIVLEVLWDEIKKRHPKATIEERQKELINTINGLAAKEIIDG